MKVHVPVLLEETVRFLSVKPDGVYADLTLGLGGHAEAVLGLLGEGGLLMGFDRDRSALDSAAERLRPFGKRFRAVKADFAEAPGLIRAAGVDAIDGFVMDLGVSTMQLKTGERGFGFACDAPLDMRMDPETGPTAAELLRELSETGLSDIIFRYGEERWAKRIARRIAERQAVSAIMTTRELAEEVKRAIPARFWPPKTHPATRTFQALRIAVNGELDALDAALAGMPGLLKPGGRAVVISYHSLEDRAVKTAFAALARGCDCPADFPRCVCGKTPALKVLTKRPVLPSEAEVRANPSARSAKLRAAERL